MTNLKEVLAVTIILAPIALVLLLAPFLPDPWNLLLALTALAAYAVCFSGGKTQGPRRIHLSRIYYVLTVVAVSAMVATYLLSQALGEAARWLGLLVVVEMAFSLPLLLYVAVASILPE